MKKTLLLLFLSTCCFAAINVPLTVQESLYAGSVAGVARTNEPVTVGVPLPDSAGIASTSVLTVSGATSAQFTVESRWPSGNIKWVKVRAIVPSLSAGGTATLTLTDGGSGNFGGGNLAADSNPGSANSGTITVNTTGGGCGSAGAICFTVKKSNFNVIDQVQIGAATVVASGASQGLVVLGPSPAAAYPGNVTCSPSANGTPCTTVYSTANDGTNSACSVEENGPSVAVLNCQADLNDGAGHVYMHTTTRLYFSQGSSKVRATVSLRNADCPTGVNCASANFTTAYKGIQGFELRLTPNLSGSLKYQIGAQTCPGGVCSGTLTQGSGDYAYVYQSEADWLQWGGDYIGGNCPAGPTFNRCVKYSPLQGYSVMNSIGGAASTQATGGFSQYASGWADISDATGAGVEIGHYQMAGYGNESLEFRSGGTDVRLGMFAAENNTTSTSEVNCASDCQPYYIPYPEYHINDVYLNFHAAAPASPGNEFLKQQHYLIARAPVAWYNSAGVFYYPLEDPTEETNFYNSVMTAYTPTVSSSAVVPQQDLGSSSTYYWPLTAHKFYLWSAGGSSNQSELRLSGVLNYLRRGHTGEYLNSAHWYKLIAETGLPRADGFSWASKPGNYTNYYNYPVVTDNNANANASLGMLNWVADDMEHAHLYGIIDYYLLSGDETYKDFIVNAYADTYLNAVSNGNFISNSGGTYTSLRSAGNNLMAISRLHNFFASIGNSAVASGLLARGNTIWTTMLKANLCTQSAGTGDPAGCTPNLVATNSGAQQDHGTSYDRGVPYIRGYYGVASYSNSCSFAGTGGQPRSFEPVIMGPLWQGMWEFRVEEGPSWADYNRILDTAFGSVQATHGTTGMGGNQVGEMFIDNGTNSWSGNGIRYIEWIDGANSCASSYGMQLEDAYWPMYWIEHQYLGQSQTNLQRQVSMQLEGVLSSCGSGFEGSCAEIWHYGIGRLIYLLNHPNNYSLVTLTPSAFKDNGDGTYNITVTVPSGATSYRVKWGSRQIVDYIGYNPATAAWIGNPATTQNWWSSNDASNIPSPGSGMQVLTVGTSPATPGLSQANFMVKVYVGGNATVTPPPPPPPTTPAPPVVSMTAPASGATVSGTITISVNATGSSALTIQFQLDGANLGSPVTGSGPAFSFSWNSTTVANGAHALTAKVTDSNGNSAVSGPVSFTVSNAATPPPPSNTGGGTTLALNTWTNLKAGGYPSAIVGYDKGVWVSSRNQYCIWGEYKAASFSEANDAMLCYSYPMNWWTLIQQVGNFHSVHRPGTGHSWGNIEYIPSLDSVWWVSDSGSNSAEAWWTMWQFDMAGLTGGVLPLMTSNGSPARQWISGAQTLAGYQSWDSVHQRMVFFPDQNNTPGEAQICNIATMNCTTSSAAGGPPQENGSGSNLRFDPDDGNTYWHGGYQQYLYRLNAATGTWQQLSAASCSGADCVNGAPTKRMAAGFAYSTADHVWLLMGGMDLNQAALTDAWKFDPAANSGNGAWTELCGPSMGACGYPGNNSVPGDRLVYDAADNVFLYDPNGAIWAYALSSPQNYARTTPSFAPPAGSLNHTAPPVTASNSTAQDPAFDLSVSSSGSVLYIAHLESSLPADFSNCYVPIPYIWSSGSAGNWLPAGTLAQGCAGIGVNASQPYQPASHVYVANAGGTVWEVHGKGDVGGSSASVQAFAQTYNPATGIWSGGAVGCFTAGCFSNNGLPKQYPQALIAAGNTATAALIEQTSMFTPATSLFVAQYSGSAWVSLGGGTPLNINPPAGSTVSFAALGSGPSNTIAACWTEEVNASRVVMSTTPQIQCKLWNGTAWSRMGSSSLNQTASDWASAPSVINVNGTWYVAFTERSQAGNPQLYLKSFNAANNSWSQVGSGSLNINASTGIPYHPSLATDGTSVFVAWEEQLSINQHSLGYVKRCASGTCTQIAGPIAADTMNGSIEDIGLAYNSGQLSLAWTERTWGNLPQVYTSTVSTAGAAPVSACDLNGDGAVNAADVQLAIQQALGLVACTNADLQGNGQCTVVDVQRVINASQGGACLTGQ